MVVVKQVADSEVPNKSQLNNEDASVRNQGAPHFAASTTTVSILLVLRSNSVPCSVARRIGERASERLLGRLSVLGSEHAKPSEHSVRLQYSYVPQYCGPPPGAPARSCGLSQPVHDAPKPLPY